MTSRRNSHTPVRASGGVRAGRRPVGVGGEAGVAAALGGPLVQDGEEVASSVCGWRGSALLRPVSVSQSMTAQASNTNGRPRG